MATESQTYSETSSASQRTKPCIACHSEIHADAKICAVCKTAQKKKDFHQLATLVKWVGGITAFISLGVGGFRLSEYYESWVEKQQIVSQLAAAADMQFNAREFDESWDTIQSALELDSGSLEVRDKQLELAMHWMRHVDWSERTTTPDSEVFARAKKLLPVLYRGAATSNGKRKGEILAHIAWAQVVLYRAEKERYALAYSKKDYSVTQDEHRERLAKVGANIENNLKSALEMSPKSVVANAVYGYWLLTSETSSKRNRYNPKTIIPKEAVVSASQYFEPAFRSGQYPEFVKKLVFRGLLNVNPSPYSEAKALFYANQLRIEGENLAWWLAKPMKWIFEKMGAVKSTRSFSPSKEKIQKAKIAMDETLSIMSPQDVVRTYLWSGAPNEPFTITSVSIGGDSDEGVKETTNPGYGYFFLKKITEKMSFEDALAMYQQLREQYPDEKMLPSDTQLKRFFNLEKESQSGQKTQGGKKSTITQ